MREKYIKEEYWSKVFFFFKNHKGVHIVNEESFRMFLEAILCITREGMSWRGLPEKYGCWNSIYRRFERWCKKGIWGDFFEYCKQDPDLENIMIDSTIVRAHACAAGQGRQKKQALGRSRGGFSTKIHVVVDALGNPLDFDLSPGQSSDINNAEKLLKKYPNVNVLGDKAYDCNNLRKTLKSRNCTPVIPGRSNRIEKIKYDKHLYKERHAIECFFGKMKYFRRVFSRYEKTCSSFLSFLYIVGAFIWLR